MWGDFFFPILAYAVSLLVLTLGAAAFHRIRAWRARMHVEPAVVVRFEGRAARAKHRSIDRRAA